MIEIQKEAIYNESYLDELYKRNEEIDICIRCNFKI